MKLLSQQLGSLRSATDCRSRPEKLIRRAHQAAWNTRALSSMLSRGAASDGVVRHVDGRGVRLREMA